MRIDASLLTALMFVGAGMGAGMMIKSGIVPVDGLSRQAPVTPKGAASAHAWPPQTGESYPDLELVGLDGQPLQVSKFRGRIVLIEPVAMTCKACQSFSGANDKGVFQSEQGGGKLDGLGALEAYVERFAGVSLDDPRVVYIQVLFYGLDAKRPPNLEQAREWAEHFGLNRANTVVAVASDRYLSAATKKMIPSFQLVDPAGVLRCDAGKKPRKDLYRELLPMMKQMLAGSPAEVQETAGATATSAND